MYTRYLAREVGPYGITANCVAPGFVRTGPVAPLLDTMSQDLLQTVALRRYGTHEDCAGAIEFLATDLGGLSNWRDDCRGRRHGLTGRLIRQAS